MGGCRGNLTLKRLTSASPCLMPTKNILVLTLEWMKLVCVCLQTNWISVFRKNIGKENYGWKIFEQKKNVETILFQPTFITDYPVEMSPLTKTPQQTWLGGHFELMVTEDSEYIPVGHLVRLRRGRGRGWLMNNGDDEAIFIDHDFCCALEYGIPPQQYCGFRIDRLCMLLTNQPSIQDVLLFPMIALKV